MDLPIIEKNVLSIEVPNQRRGIKTLNNKIRGRTLSTQLTFVGLRVVRTGGGIHNDIDS